MAAPAAELDGAAAIWPAKLSIVALSVAVIETDGALIVVLLVVELPICAMVVFEMMLATADPAPEKPPWPTATPTPIAKPLMLSSPLAVTSTAQAPVQSVASVVMEASLMVALRVSLIAL